MYKYSKREFFEEVSEDELAEVKSRTIEEVFDMKEGEYIESSSFFKKPENEIVLWRRVLEEAILINKPRFVCSHCGQMVKLLGRRTARGKIAFFAHLHDSEDCDIKTNSSHLSKEEILARKYGKIQESERHINLKNFIAKYLQTEKSKELGVSDVEVEKRIKSKIPYLNWRKPDVFAQFRNKNLVFELQLSTTFISVVVERDIFYRLNNYHIIWIFNFDANQEYVNIHNLMCKDIYYANKRNIFILDREAQEKSKIEDTLYLKCLWIDENGKLSKGVLISLDNLQFDEESCKPYFLDADELYYKRFPEKKEYIKKFEHSKQELLEGLIKRMELSYQNQLQLEEDQKKAIEKMTNLNENVIPFDEGGLYGYKYENTIMTFPYYKTAEEINSDGYAIVTRGRKKGLVNRFGQNIVPCCYKQIIWTPEKHFIVQQGKQWKIFGSDDVIRNVSTCDHWNFRKINEELEVAELKYLRYWDSRDDCKCVDIVFSKSGNHRLLKDVGENFVNGYLSAKTISYESDSLLSIEATCILNDNLVAYQNEIDGFIIVSNHLGLYGFCDTEHQTVIPFEYDNIKYLEKNTYLVKKEGKYGLISNYNEQLQITIPVEYDIIKNIGLDIYLAKKGGKYGLISNFNNYPRITVPIEYNSIKQVEENRFVVEKNDWSCGVIDDSNETIIPISYSYIEKDSVHSHHWIVEKNNKYGVFHENNGLVIPAVFSHISPKGLFRQTIANKTNLNYLREYELSFDGSKKIKNIRILSTGDYVITYSYSLSDSKEYDLICDKEFRILFERDGLHIEGDFDEGKLKVTDNNGSAFLTKSYGILPEEEYSIGNGYSMIWVWGKCGIMKGTEQILAPEYSEILPFDNVGYLAKNHYNTQLVDYNFHVLAEGDICNIQRWDKDNNFFLIEREKDNKGNRYCLYNSDAKPILQKKYKDIFLYYDCIAFTRNIDVSSSIYREHIIELMGLVRKDGVFIFECDYSSIHQYYEHIFYGINRGNQIFRNYNGRTIYYQDIKPLINNYYYGINDGVYQLINDYGLCVSQNKFKQLKVQDGEIVGLCGYQWINAITNAIIQIDFTNLSRLNDYYYISKEKNKYGLVDAGGNIVVDCQYSNIHIENEIIVGNQSLKKYNILTGELLEDMTPQKGSICNGVITNITKLGLFIEIEGIGTGLLHWTSLRKRNDNQNNYHKGEHINVVISRVINEKVELELPPLTPEEGRKYSGIITNITKLGLFIEVGGLGVGLLHWTKLKERNDTQNNHHRGEKINVVISKIRDDGKFELEIANN